MWVLKSSPEHAVLRDAWEAVFQCKGVLSLVLYEELLREKQIKAWL